MLNQNKVGLALGGFLAFYHVIWAVIVASGFGDTLLGLIFRLHMLENPFVVGPFSLGLAISLVIVTGVIGYVVGWMFAWFYNWAHK